MMIFAVSTTWAQSPPPADQAEQIRMLIERVQQLEKRVAELEPKVASATAVAAPATAAVPAKTEVAVAAPPPAPVQSHQHEMTEAPATPGQMEVHYPSLQIRGFGDVDFSATDQKGAIS